MERYSIRRDVKRFVVEALCLLMVLYGAPLQALQAAASPVAEAASSEAVVTNVDEAGFLATAAEAISSTVAGGVEKAETFAGQPWMDALSILLAMGAGEETPGAPGYLTDAVPPLPPGFSESSGRGPSAVSRAAAGRSVGIPGAPASTEALLASKSHLDAIPLLGGWNLLSIPEEPTDPDPATVLAPIAGSFSQVFAFDACDPGDPWKLYDPADAAASDLLELDPTKGFWIDATTAASLPSDGTLAPTTSWQLCTGWNLIGYPAGEPRHIRNALQSIEGKYIRAFGFELADPTDPWEIWDIAAPDWANDLTFLRPGFGYWILVTEDTTLTIANQADAPTVEITSPADLAEITAPTTIRGIVQSEILESWTLTYRPVGEGPWLELGTGNFPVDDAPLATFDPTLLLNGMYEIRLEAVDIAGMAVEETIAVVVEGKMKIGHFSVSFTDLSVKLAGLAIQINRTYDTRDRGDRDFGYGWRLEILQGSYRNNRPPGDGWQILEGFLPCENILETKTHLTTIRLSDIEIYRFALALDRGAPTLGGCFAEAAFSFVEGPLPGSTLEILGETDVFYANASDQVVFPDTQEPYEPQRVRLTTRDGRVFEFDLDEGVQRVLDSNGNSVAITPESIVHSAGHTINFERDAAGRIDSITDPMGRVMTYGRDSNGDLSTFTDRGGNITRYSYDGDHRLTAIEDPSGNRPIRNEYDDEGRVVRHIDAFGRVIELTHDVEGRQEILTNRLGHSTLVEYDDRGNNVRQVNPLGEVEVRTFDSRGNLLTETDPLGRATVRTYSAASEVTSITNPLGQTATTTFSDLGRPLVVTDPLGRVTRHEYDERGNRTRTVDAAGGETVFVNDASGRRTSETDPMSGTRSYVWNGQNRLTKVTDEQGAETAYAYDANGNLLSESTTRTTPSGPEVSTRTFEYDALDRRIRTTDPDGSVTLLEYDRLSRVIRETDELGRTLEREFDEAGRLALLRYPDGTTVQRTYDAEGNLLTEIDRDGEVIEHTYDPVGRRTSSRFADGATETNVYDAAGQLVTAIDALGHAYTSELDAAGRRVKLTDPLGHETLMTYDAAGNLVSTRDAEGHTTTTEYNVFDLVTKVTTPDGASVEQTYDALRRVSGVTDPNGAATRFEYDGSSDRITKVIDALGQDTVFTYDAHGNRTSQTDAKGRSTLFEHDSLGRLLKRTYPDGSSESFTYNPDGTLASKTNLDGGTTTWQYDVNQQEVRRVDPEGGEITFTYTPGGDRATVTDARGTTTYTYDIRGRLERLTYPDGRQLRYAYDANGNRTRVEAVVGTEVFSTTYAYDVLDRLQTVTDAQGRTYSHTYDANGNRTALTFPNGITTSTTFDLVNRLTRLATEVGGGPTLQSYDFTLDAAGWRQRIDELDGTARQLSYDPLYRLTREKVVDGGGTIAADRLYTYDEVGNRVGEQTTIDSITTMVDSVFDTRDRLLGQSSGETYGWDANGNLTSRTGVEPATLDWDGQGRLVGMTFGDGSQTLTRYDAEGNRVRSEMIPPSGPSQITDYLVDPEAPHSRVVLETDDAGEVSSYYVWGDELLAIVRPGLGETRFVHADGLGSVRLLTDGTATVTDTYTYDAFGELVEHTGDDPNIHLFAGEPLDRASGFYYNRARWLDPSVGRFVSIDPFEGSASDPLSLHRYLYAKNDPVNRIDPSGKESVVSFNVAAAINTLIAATLIVLHLQNVRSQVAINLFPVRGLPTLADVNAAFAALATSILLQQEIARTKDNVRRWRKKERGKRKRLLFHYSDKEGACAIATPPSRINITANGTFGRAAYATNIPPVVDFTDLTRSQLVRLLFGDKDFNFRFSKTSHWVAFIGGRDWKNRGVIFYRPVAPPNTSVRITALGKGATLLRGDD